MEANILPKLLILTFPWARTHKPAEPIKMIFGVEADLQKFERILQLTCTPLLTRMWANAQRDGRPAEYRWRPLFNAAKFG